MAAGLPPSGGLGGSGASHAGLGGQGANIDHASPAYGNVLEPADYGSGGALMSQGQVGFIYTEISNKSRLLPERSPYEIPLN